MSSKIEPADVNESGIKPAVTEIRKRWNILVSIYDGRHIADRFSKIVTGKPLKELNKKEKRFIGKSLAKLGAEQGWDQLAIDLWQWEINPDYHEYFEKLLSNKD